MHRSNDQKHFNKLNNLFTLLKAIRIFFNQQHFIEVLTPPAVSNPGMETHIHPFRLKSLLHNQDLDLYLHTSPEFHMKELLSYGFGDIFTLGYCFRDEPDSQLHRKQFIMLEWYRKNAHYTQIMDDCEQLLIHCLHFLKDNSIKINETLLKQKFERRTVSELFQEFLHFDILDFLDKKDLYKKIQKDFCNIPLPPADKLSWDDCFFLLFLNKLEEHIENFPYLLLYEYPHHLSALSTLKKDDPRVCERFEIYLHGIELCNCFNELTDLNQQIERFDSQREEKKSLYHYELPPPEVLYASMRRGLPTSAGIALGVERLLMALSFEKDAFWPYLESK